MNRDFSHLPACVERSASGICRASAIISEMVCSAVVMELPNGVFMTITPLAVAAFTSMLSTPMPAAPTPARLLGRGQHLLSHPRGRAHRQAIIFADDRLQFFLWQANPHVGGNAALPEDAEGGGRELIGYQNSGAHGDAGSVLDDATQ